MKNFSCFLIKEWKFKEKRSMKRCTFKLLKNPLNSIEWTKKPLHEHEQMPFKLRWITSNRRIYEYYGCITTSSLLFDVCKFFVFCCIHSFFLQCINTAVHNNVHLKVKLCGFVRWQVFLFFFFLWKEKSTLVRRVNTALPRFVLHNTTQHKNSTQKTKCID